VEWLLQRNVAVLVLELGGNDGLRGIPTETTRQNLQGIIDRTREVHPDARILLAGMQIPPNMGVDYASRFAEMYPELARQNNVELIPFVLEGVGGVRELNLPDGIHPTARGQEIVADNVWEVLEPVLREIQVGV
jgi:acyl-CoA thioesterase I